MKQYIITLLLLMAQLPCLAQQAVDLGLSVAWADRNLGAKQPTDAGLMLAWGELEGKSEYTLGTYRLGTGEFWHPTKYVSDSQASYSTPDGLSRLEAEDDAITYLLDVAFALRFTPRIISHDNYKETPRCNGCAVRAVKE